MLNQAIEISGSLVRALPLPQTGSCRAKINSSKEFCLAGAEDLNITALLEEWRSGKPGALDRLMPVVYDELRLLAGRYMRDEREGHTLQSTAIVHEAYLRLAGYRGMDWKNRAQFFGVAATVIRHILVDHARARAREKRGSSALRLSLDEAIATPYLRDPDLVALDDAMLSLGVLDPRQCRIVELRYFGGLTVEETAEVLDISSATVKRDWSLARAFLYRDLAAQSAFSPLGE